MIANSTNNPFKKKYPGVVVNTIFAAILFAGILFLHYNRPVLYMGLILEDYWGEYATFVCYMLASLLFGWTALKDKNLQKPGMVLLALATFIIGMEEISWGQRILNIETPYAISKLNYQSELTIHNMIDTVVPIGKLFFIAVAIWIFLLPFAARIFKPLRTYILKWGIPFVGAAEYPFFLISLFFFVFSPVIKSDEVWELLMAIAFAAFAQTMFFDALNRAGTPTKDIFKRKLALITGVFLCAWFFVSMFGIAIPRQNARLKGQLHWTATIDYPGRKLFHQAGKLFEHILANEKLIRKETYLQYGILLSQTDNPKAEAILYKAIQQESAREIDDSENPKYSRNKGVIYKLLKDEIRARIEFERSIQKDKNRLEKIDRYWPVMSMAKTGIAMENYDLALENLEEAKKLAPGAIEKFTAQSWMDRVADKNKITRGQYLQILQYIYL